MKQIKQTTQAIKQPKQLTEKEITKIEKECKLSIAKTEEYISEKGWGDYIDKCVDIIYFNFNNFGWTYGIDTDKKVTREEIKDNIKYLIEESIKAKTQIETGRIAVDIVEDQLWIAMTL